MTVATDLALAAGCTAFTVLLLGAGGTTTAHGFWIAAFASVGAGAAFGAAAHGLPDSVSSGTQRALWIIALTLSGATGILFAVAGLTAAFAGLEPSTATVAAAMAFALYAVALAVAPDFRTAAAVSVLSAVALVVSAVAMAPTRPHVAQWLGAGVALSVMGVVVQRLGVLAGRRFNHNDLYHVLQLVGFYCLYRAAAAHSS